MSFRESELNAALAFMVVGMVTTVVVGLYVLYCLARWVYRKLCKTKPLPPNMCIVETLGVVADKRPKKSSAADPQPQPQPPGDGVSGGGRTLGDRNTTADVTPERGQRSSREEEAMRAELSAGGVDAKKLD